MATAGAKLLEISTLASGATARLHLLSTFKGRVRSLFSSIDTVIESERTSVLSSNSTTAELTTSTSSMSVDSLETLTMETC